MPCLSLLPRVWVFGRAAAHAGVSVLEMIRIGILLYQRAIERETESSKIEPLKPEEQLSDDERLTSSDRNIE